MVPAESGFSCTVGAREPMMRKVPNAVIEADLRKLLADGWHLVILCRETPEFRHSQCYSDWVMRIARPDGGEEYPLVLGRPPIR